MHGDEPEVLDGTQLAADWTFSGLQKFGQGLNDRLRGHKLPNKLLSRVSFVFISNHKISTLLNLKIANYFSMSYIHIQILLKKMT